MTGENSPVNGSDSQKGAEDRKIFVGGISAEVSNEDLQQHFQQFGEVAQAQVKIDRATGRSRGFAFVEFANADACRKALSDREQTIKGKACEIKPAKSRENKKVFVGGIPADHPEEELRKYFEQFGKVDDVEWPFDKQTKTRRNFAFIVFEEEDATERAVAQPKHTFSDRECDVKKAVPQSRRFNNFRGQMGGGPRGFGGGMQRMMPTHNAAPWYNGGWGQMSNMYAGQSGQHSGNWGGDWNPQSYGYFQGGQQGNYGYGNSDPSAGYDYSQNGNSNRGSQNGSSGQRQQNYQSQY
jgi:RNA recognition motif-containing protein